MNTNKAQKYAEKLCNEGCISPFKCERKQWQDKIDCHLPKVGVGIECPLKKFEAEKKKYLSFREALFNGRLAEYRREQLTEDKLAEICKACEFGRREDAFFLYCIDCPVQNAVENIIETRAEASCS